jgi:PIN domain nuclease of toxin-antitoxin system
MSLAVLDASAVLAMLLKEPGADEVERIIADSVISTVNLGEVVGHYTRAGADIDAVHRLVDPLPMDRTDFDEDLAFTVAWLLPITKALGLSYADRACLALAIRLDIPAVTSDQIWGRLPQIDKLTVKLIR